VTQCLGDDGVGRGQRCRVDRLVERAVEASRVPVEGRVWVVQPLALVCCAAGPEVRVWLNMVRMGAFHRFGVLIVDDGTLKRGRREVSVYTNKSLSSDHGVVHGDVVHGDV
jgi:hypothetical protein